MQFSSRLALTLAAWACALPVMAANVTFDFANLRGKSTDFKPSEQLNSGYWKCTGSDLCSSNLDGGRLGGDLQYSAGGINVSATGFYRSGNSWQQVTVVQDAEAGYDPARMIGAGLGVYHKTGDNSDDNITSGEKLVLTFSKPVYLQSLMLRSDGHNTSWNPNSTFLFNGQSTKLSGLITNMHAYANRFEFTFGGNKPDQFYLGGIVVSQVPEAETWGMLGVGLLLLGLAKRRQRA